MRLPRELSIAIVKPWELLPLILADDPRGHYAAGMVEQGGHCATCAQRCNGFLFWAKSGRVQLAAMIAECAQQPDEWIATQASSILLHVVARSRGIVPERGGGRQ
ncbi:MAG: hypothetical protein ACLP4V_29340 [Methylocella sp.]